MARLVTSGRHLRVASFSAVLTDVTLLEMGRVSSRVRKFGMRLYVGNLPFSVSSEDLEQMFSEYGEVTSSQLIADRDTGRSRGFGFVELADDEAGQKAIDEMDGKDSGGRRLTVNVAREREERPRRFDR